MSRRLVLLVSLFGVPLAAWAFVPPARILETIWGISCIDEVLCVDDMVRSKEAADLYEGALEFLASTIVPLAQKPLVVFCATERCFQSFGDSKATARSIGRFCIIVSPRGWKPFYVRHELIHRLQVQQMGVVRQALEPTWFIEGMAYSLSEDPRSELPQPHQQYRSQFEAWYAEVGRDRLWDVAAMP